jgi:hypothetical protein
MLRNIPEERRSQLDFFAPDIEFRVTYFVKECLEVPLGRFGYAKPEEASCFSGAVSSGSSSIGR